MTVEQYFSAAAVRLSFLHYDGDTHEKSPSADNLKAKNIMLQFIHAVMSDSSHYMLITRAGKFFRSIRRLGIPVRFLELLVSFMKQI